MERENSYRKMFVVRVIEVFKMFQTSIRLISSFKSIPKWILIRSRIISCLLTLTCFQTPYDPSLQITRQRRRSIRRKLDRREWSGLCTIAASVSLSQSFGLNARPVSRRAWNQNPRPSLQHLSDGSSCLRSTRQLFLRWMTRHRCILAAEIMFLHTV